MEKETGRISINNAISCGFIINELVSNAIQHAITNYHEGMISINIGSSKKNHVITIHNDGIGFPKNIDFYNPSSFGLKLVHMLVKQLKGTISMERKNGSTFIVRFPKEKGVV